LRVKYGKAEKIFAELPDTIKDSESKIMLAKSLYHQGKLETALEHFEKLYIRDEDDRLLLARLYARTGRSLRAKELLLRFYSSEPQWKKVKSDPYLMKTAAEIEADKKREAESRIPDKPVHSEPKN